MTNNIKTILEYFNNRQFIEAIKLSNIFLKQKKYKSEIYKIYNIKGLSFFNLKKYNLSKINYLNSLNIQEDKNVLYNYAVVLVAKKNYDLCLAVIDKLINGDDQNFSYYTLLFNIKSNVCFIKKEKVNDLLSRALRINPSDKNLPDFINFINFLSKNNELIISKFLCERALSLNNHVIYFLYSQIQRKISNQKVALNYLIKAISIDGSNYLYFHQLGSLYEEMGNFPNAIDSFKKSLELNSNFGSTYRSLANLKELNENNVNSLLRRISFNSNNDNFTIHAYYALSKYYFDKQDHDQCHHFYTCANNIRKKTSKLNLSWNINYINSFSKLAASISSNKKFKLGPSKDIRPIFIIGLPRSGSTLVEQILGSHSKILPNGEINYFFNSLEKYLPTTEILSNKIELDNIDDNLLIKISNFYYKQFKIEKNNIIYITDKMLFNFYYIDLMKIIFPQSQVIFCTRDYRDIFMSIIRNYFSDKNFNFGNDKTDLLNFIKFYNNHIKNSLNKYDDIIIIKYENLVSSLEEEVTSLLKSLNLSFETACLNFNQSSNMVKTASSFQVRNKIYDSSVNLWSNYKKFYKDEFRELEVLNNF
jgi:tetratricopeptide (TPR) repeat protein